MSQAFIVEVFGCTAGILAKEGNRFRFYASSPAMKPLEGQMFRNPKEAERAADQITTTKLARRINMTPAHCRALY
jgi:hypothetical protein